MTRPAIPHVLRVMLVAFGICSLAFAGYALWQFRGCGIADGTVVVYPVVDEWNRTNIETHVSFTAPDASKAVVMASDIPSGLRAGEHFRVVYDRTRWIKDSWLLRDIIGVPASALVLGVVLTGMGLFARSRGILFTRSHANAA